MRQLPSLLTVLLLACSPADAPVGLVAAVITPADGDVVLLGEALALSGAATVDGAPVVANLTWTSSREGVIGHGASVPWTPAQAGTHAITLLAAHADDVVSADVSVTVQVPSAEGVTRLGVGDGLPEGATWNDLAIDADGLVYGATSAGLVIVGDDVRVLGAADGLAASAVSAVAAAADGTVWVGYDGVEGIEAQQVAIGDDVEVLRDVHFTLTGEIHAVYRMAVQPFGVGAGDVWMGTNEGVCLHDVHLDQSVEHGHPRHPHGPTHGLAFTSGGDVWNGDAHQLSRWRYRNDGNVFSAFAEVVDLWDVLDGDPIHITDLATAPGDVLWVASASLGLARVHVGAIGESAVAPMSDPFPAAATAVAAAPDGRIWIGTSDGLLVHDTAVGGVQPFAGISGEAVQQIEVDSRTAPPTVWVATERGLVRIVGAHE